MKRTILLFVAAILNVNSFVMKVPTVVPNDKIVSVTSGRVHIQKLLTPLFEDVCEESSDPIIIRLSEEFQNDPKNGDYINPDAIDDFLNLKTNKGLLAKGKIFTEYSDDHINELKVIYDILLNAGNFDTFYKVACWARQNVNCGVFIDAIYLAIIKRRDTERVLLPALYEVLPNYFIRKDYIIKASSLLSGYDFSSLENVHNDGNSYILDVNYTDNYFDNNIEPMSYFYEDVDLNSYYFFNKLKILKWSNNEILELRNQRGEYIYHTMKQLNARYNLERYSNGMSEIEAINWDVNDECVYDPLLLYSNGHEFNQRSSLVPENKNYISLLKNIESNITSMVTHMRDAGYNKSEIFNRLMDVLVTDELSYENIAIQLLNNFKSETGTTSVLGHYMTTLRDPIFWRLNNKIVEMVDNAVKVLSAYNRNQLYFPGVEVTNIDVKKLTTSCDKYEFDVTDALRIKEIESRFQIKFNQYRLNHKPFTVKISISSLVIEKALIKLYIGPKVLPSHLLTAFTDRKNLFMELDSFEVNLKIGTNTITRTSNEMNKLSDEFISLKTIRKYIEDAEFGIDALPLRTIDSQTGFPSRLLLPKGTTTPFHIFVFVAPFIKAIVGETRNYLQSNYDAILSPGYPLDLGIDIQSLFDLPNALVKDVIITHKISTAPQISDTNSYYNWQNNNTEFDKTSTNLMSSFYLKPNYSSKTFDYKSKKEKYGKNRYEFNPELNKNAYAKVITDDKHVDESIVQDKQDEEQKSRFDNVIIDIEPKEGEYRTKPDEFVTKLSENDYEKVITIDKSFTDKYSNDKQDEEENKRFENVVINIEGEHESKQDLSKTKNIQNDYKKDITVDKNANVNVTPVKLDEKEENEKDYDNRFKSSTQPTKLYKVWWDYHAL